MADKKIIGEKNEATRQARIVSQWQAFSHTDAYKDFMEYGDAQQAMFLHYAEELAMPHPTSGKGLIPISENAGMNLLQNRRGIGIMTSYAKLRAEKQG